MNGLHENKYIALSAVLHVGLFLIFVLGFDFAGKMPVIENTNKQDVISAVILGDSTQSKMIPHEQPAPPLPKLLPPKQDIAKPQPLPVKKDVIALNKPLLKKSHDELLKDMMADMKTLKKSVKNKDPLKHQFEKIFKEQAQQSLRENIDDDLKLQTTQSRQSQGEVDKYKALILQVISEHWVIPPQVRKSLYSTLMIRLAPGGMVLDVQVVRASGDPALDSSARAAVLKSSPLPVPSDPKAFEAFKQFTLKVRPDTVL